MSISDKIKAAITIRNKQNTEIAAALGISAQTFNNKLYRNAFTAGELITIADALHFELAFIDKDGQKLLFLPADIEKQSEVDG